MNTIALVRVMDMKIWKIYMCRFFSIIITHCERQKSNKFPFGEYYHIEEKQNKMN